MREREREENFLHAKNLARSICLGIGIYNTYSSMKKVDGWAMIKSKFSYIENSTIIIWITSRNKRLCKLLAGHSSFVCKRYATKRCDSRKKKMSKNPIRKRVQIALISFLEILKFFQSMLSGPLKELLFVHNSVICFLECDAN